MPRAFNKRLPNYEANYEITKYPYIKKAGINEANNFEKILLIRIINIF